MRSAARAYAIDIVVWLVVAAAIAAIWVVRAAPIDAVVAVSAVAAVVATLRQHAMQRLRREAAQAAVVRRAAEQAADAARAAETTALRSALVAEVNAIIVEVVAVGQGVVRAAHPDDVLLRVNAADDAAHALLDRVQAIGVPAPRGAADHVDSCVDPGPRAGAQMVESGSVASGGH